MLEAIASRLKVGHVNIGNHFASYSVTSQQDLVKIFSIFDRQGFPLNTSKHLNYLMLSRKKGHELYFNRQSSRQISSEVANEILALKDQMNKKRIEFEYPSEAGHRVNITPY